MKRILVIQAMRPEAYEIFAARGDVSHVVVSDPLEENLLLHAADADAITVRDAVIPESVIRVALRLKVVSRHGVGYDNIPLALCTERGIPVTVVGPVNVVSVAEQTMFLMLAAARSGIELDAAVRRGDFAARSRVTGVELRGRNLLMIGYGRIGREVAAIAEAFGMKIMAYDPFLSGEMFENVEIFASLDAALSQAQVVSLHVPLSEQTRGMLGRRELALLPRGAIVVNASRGGLVDEAALVDEVRSGRLRGAGLDTFEVEPLPVGSPLLGEPRIVLSPHSAALTEEALVAMGRTAARNALAGLDGTLDPDLVVNREVLNLRAAAPGAGSLQSGGAATPCE